MSPGTKKLLIYGGGAASIVALIVLFIRSRNQQAAQQSGDQSGGMTSIDGSLLPLLAGIGSGGLGSLVSGPEIGSGGNNSTTSSTPGGSCITGTGGAGTFDSNGNCVANPSPAPPANQGGVTSGTVITTPTCTESGVCNTNCTAACKKFGLRGQWSTVRWQCTCV